MKIPMNEKKLNFWFSVFIVLGMTVMISIATFKGYGGAGDKTLFLLSAVASILGGLSCVLSSNGLIINFLFGLINVIIYGTTCLVTGKYGIAALTLLYQLPMQVVGIFQWKKLGHSQERGVNARRLTAGRRWTIAGVFIISSAILYFILLRFDTTGETGFIKYLVLTDALVVMCNVFGQFLMSMAYMEQWLFWIGVNVFTLAMWKVDKGSVGSSYAQIYIFKYMFYLLNSLNGLRIWLKLSRGNGLEN